MRRSERPLGITLRRQVKPSDLRRIASLVRESGYFSEREVAVARELVRERLSRGTRSGYFFLFADHQQYTPLGYTCYGPIPGTEDRYDLYWIVVATMFRGHGIGRLLLSETERLIAQRGGTILFVETSSRPLYEPTRRFYHSCQYREEATVHDFYAPGDHKLIFSKTLTAAEQQPHYVPPGEM